jgi:hypothetical protein
LIASAARRVTSVNKSINVRPSIEDQHLTVEECDELSQMLRQDAASMQDGPQRRKLLELAECYAALASLKKLVLGNVN